jgi:hypothetical protein
MTPDEFSQYKQKAKTILGYMPMKNPCLTCQTPDAQLPKKARLPNKKCLIRQCVDKTSVKNCAYCSRFPCDTLKATAGLWNRESIEVKLDESLSEEDYTSFVKPFEGLQRLTAIQASLKPHEIVKPITVGKSESHIVPFPKNLSFKDKNASYKKIYKLLITLGTDSFGLRNADTFAEHHKLENQRIHIFRFLWIMGKYGLFKNANHTHLVINAETYLDNRRREKTLAIWSFVKTNVFKILTDVGVYCERVALTGVKKEDLTTGTGYLRKKGWIMTMSFGETLGGTTSIKAYQTYIQKLDQTYGTKAFQHFRNVDMTIL